MAVYPYELSELLENTEYSPEYNENSEYTEANRGRGGRGNVQTARSGPVVPPRPDPGYATKAELTTATNRLDARIAVNSTAIKSVEGRVNNVVSEHGKLRTEVNKLQGGLNDVRNMAMLMPLLSTEKTVSTTSTVGGIPSGSKVVVDSGDSFSKMLPLLLFSGAFGSTSGSSSSGSGGMFGGDSGGIMLVAMMMALQGRN